MVTIRNDIEANGNATRATDSAASAVDGTKNVNHLANGSRRSTMADIKPKAVNGKCVGLLALIVCVGVCFGVGMLFLYGHLVDRLNESASHGSMLHDKNGNPVKPFTTTTTATITTTTTTATSTTPTTTTEQMVTSAPTTEMDISTSTSTPSTTSTTEMSYELTTPAKRRQGMIFFDTFIGPSAKEKSTEASIAITTARNDNTKDKGTINQRAKPRGGILDADYASSGDDTDDDDDDFGSGSGSGNNK